MLKLFIYIFVLNSFCAYSQGFKPNEIVRYTKKIDSLINHKSLTEVKYRNMSFCGGALKGYYLKNKLVFIHSVYAGELGYIEQKIYLKDTIPYKLTYREYFPEWEKYYLKYPDKEKELNEANMSYTDTIYHISFTSPIKISKYSKNKYISKNIEKDLLVRIISCIKKLFYELEDEIQHKK